MAYAAVISLMGTLDLHFLQSQPRFPLQHKQEIVSLHENLGFLQEILEKSEIAAYDNEGAMKDLEAEMRDVLFKAEEMIEMELSSIYRKPSSIEACLLRLHGIFNQALEQTDYLKKKLIKIKSKYQIAKGSSLGSTSSSQPDPERENITVSKFSKNASKFDSRMVGCEEEFMKILDQLRQKSAKQLQVVSIIGMGGIGKTTLAQKIYENPSITSHFEKRAWVTVSQEYNVEQMLRCLIACVTRDEESNNQDQLLVLQQRLRGQRYLIVMDDIWSTTAWDSVQGCFPDDNNGSRILLTSRLREVAEYASSGNSPLNMPFLDLVESWNLYCKVFGKREFPFEFEQIGRDIVKKCEGLPLAIIVAASLLSKTEELEKWKTFAENVSRFVIGDSKNACSRILYLSYNQLPHHLKACFLYFGVFREDYEIPVKKLVRLWVAEGFLRAEKCLSLEEVAMECLQDLVDRSLVIVSQQRYNGEVKTIRIHDMLRDLCLREGGSENLLNVIGDENPPFYKRMISLSKPCRWISDTGSLSSQISSKCFHKSHSLHSTSVYIPSNVDVKRLFSHFKLLRVVDIKTLFRHGDNVLRAVPNLVHLRYLALILRSEHRADALFVHLFEHWNMQSFIVRGDCVTMESSMASRIWKMPLLRNFYVEHIFSLETSSVVYSNLENISWLDPKLCTKDLFTRIPNLKKLGIHGDFSRKNSDCFYNFVYLEQLEKLSIKDWFLWRDTPWTTSLPPNLKKLNLVRTGTPWSDMRLIGMLPNLEVLKLLDTCRGSCWEPIEGGFLRLKRLVIESRILKYWNAMGDHFPVLECLELRHCCHLEKIPSDFADITTLALIRLSKCWDSLLASAEWIQNEQRSYGNDSLLVLSEDVWPIKKRMW